MIARLFGFWPRVRSAPGLDRYGVIVETIRDRYDREVGRAVLDVSLAGQVLRDPDRPALVSRLRNHAVTSGGDHART